MEEKQQDFIWEQVHVLQKLLQSVGSPAVASSNWAQAVVGLCKKSPMDNFDLFLVIFERIAMDAGGDK